MTKYLMAAIAALLIVVAALGYAVKQQVGSAAVLKQEVKVLTDAQKQAATRLKKDRAALVAREAKIAAQTRKLAEAQQALSRALQAEKAWSDTDVPTPVQKALTGDPGGSNGSPASVLDRSDREGEPEPGASPTLP